MEEEVKYLIKISADSNTNRYYRMIPESHGDCFIVEMGRIGVKPVKCKKPMTLWEICYQKKINEGYIDRSEFCTADKKEIKKYKEVENEEVRNLLADLQKYANRVLEASYTVTYKDVTENMISEAQKVIFEMSENQKDILKVKEYMAKLFVIIPRKMKNVSEMMPTSISDIPLFIQKEQDLLDVMEAKVSQEKKKKTDAAPSQTILDVLKMSIRPCNEKENIQIKKHLSKESEMYFSKAFRVVNEKTEENFWNYFNSYRMNDKDIHYFYHGSKNQNYFGLLTEGPKLNPKAAITGKMFGHGIYFANRAKKSINYTDLAGSYWAKGGSNKAYLAVYKVCYKNPKHISRWEQEMTSYNKRQLLPYDALYAHKGVSLYNDEIIVYDESQMTIQYIIELKVKQ